MKVEYVNGTKCSNCTFTEGQEAVRITKKDMNTQGGIDSKSAKDIAGAKAADLITMPGSKFPSVKVKCTNSTVAQFVTERMCCNFWKAPGMVHCSETSE